MNKKLGFLLFFLTISFLKQGWSQNKITIPEFSGEILYLRVFESVSAIPLGGFGNPTLSISDGTDVSFSTELKICKSANELENVKTIASVMNQIRKQGYRLVSTSNGAQGIQTGYLFEKGIGNTTKENK